MRSQPNERDAGDYACPSISFSFAQMVFDMHACMLLVSRPHLSSQLHACRCESSGSRLFSTPSSNLLIASRSSSFALTLFLSFASSSFAPNLVWNHSQRFPSSDLLLLCASCDCASLNGFGFGGRASESDENRLKQSSSIALLAHCVRVLFIIRCCSGDQDDWQILTATDRHSNGTRIMSSRNERLDSCF